MNRTYRFRPRLGTLLVAFAALALLLTAVSDGNGRTSFAAQDPQTAPTSWNPQGRDCPKAGILPNSPLAVTIESLTLNTTRVTAGGSISATLTLKNTSFAGDDVRLAVYIRGENGTPVYARETGIVSVPGGGTGDWEGPSPSGPITVGIPASATGGSHTVTAYVLPHNSTDLANACDTRTGPDVTVTAQDNNPPPVPRLSSPASGTETTDTTPTLRWSAVTDPEGSNVGYEIEVSTSSSFSPGSTTGLSTTSASHTPSPALSPDRYYWRVRARDSEGNYSRWSSTRFFTVARPQDNNPPTVPRLSSPASGTETTDTTPTLRWSAVTDPEGSNVGYEIEVSTSSSFSPGSTTGLSTTSASHTPSPALSPDRYYWRVRARDSEGNYSRWSSSWNFTVARPQDNNPPTISSFQARVSSNPAHATVSTFQGLVGGTTVTSRTVSAYPGDRIVFRASAGDQDGDLSSYAWNVDGLTVETRNTSGSSSTQTYGHTAKSGQDYTVTATFTDGDNASATVAWTVEVLTRSSTTGLPGGLTMADVPDGWHPLSQLIYAALEESSLGVGNWNIPDVRVYLGTEPAGSAFGSSERVLRIRLEHDPAAIVKDLTARASEMVGLVQDMLWEIGVTDPEKIDAIVRPIVKEALVFILENIGLKGTFLPFEVRSFGYTVTYDGVDIAEIVADALAEVLILGARASAVVVDSALDLLRTGLDQVNTYGDFTTQVVEVVTSVIAIAAASTGPVGALSAVLQLDYLLGFDSIGQITVVTPKTTWIDYGGEERRIDRFWTFGYQRYLKDEEEAQVQIRLAVERLLEITRELILGTALPVVGTWIGAGISSIEYLSAAFPEELKGPQSVWFKKRTYNCTNRITIPWDLALINARGVDVQIPMDLNHGDFIGVYSTFTTYSTWKSVLNVNIPKVREHGEFEVTGEFREGEPLNTDALPPDCNSSTFTDARPVSRAAVTASPAVLTVEEGSSASYSVRLESQPSSTVTVSIAGQAGSDLTVSPSSLTFNTGNWSSPKTVRVTAQQDADATPDDFITLSHRASGGGYSGAAVENAVIIVQDDEAPTPGGTRATGTGGPRWQSSATEIIPLDGTGGRLEVKVLTVGVGIDDRPYIAVEGTGLDRSRRTNGCSLTYRPFGHVPGIDGTRCWHISFNMPVNDTGSERTYKVTATTDVISEDYVTEATVSPTPVTSPAPTTPGTPTLTASPPTLTEAGGGVVARVVVPQGGGSIQAPTFSVSGPALTGSTTRRGAACRSASQLAPGDACWEASFTIPRNGTTVEREYSISVSGGGLQASPRAVRVTVPGMTDISGDRGALVALYNATGGPSWRSQRNWLSAEPIERWQGVVADANGNVTQLILNGYGLNGSLPPELGNLRSLNTLILANNTLTGLPRELGRLSNLTLLDLNNSRLSGPIPRELGDLANLDSLSLQQNQLSGPIPQELGNLANLTLLRLGGNQLTGCIPDTLRGVSSNDLRSLPIPFCEFDVGVPPPVLGDRFVLEMLYHGTDGPNWRTQGNWNTLDPLSRWAGVYTDGNEKVTQLVRNGSGLKGTLPRELGDLTHLTRLVLDNNKLTGLPPELGKLTNLTILDVNFSELGGRIPPELGNLTNLQRLTLQDNRLTGEIPSELGNLTNLALLRLGGNQFTGCIPDGLKRVPNNDFSRVGLPFCEEDDTGGLLGDRVYVTGGTLNGTQLNSTSPSITVTVGESITGTVGLDVHNDHRAGAVFPVEATPTWGEHRASYWRVPMRVPAFGSARYDAPVNLTAPDTPGNYAIIFVAQAELSGGYVASATHWDSGQPRWDNGDDVAGWDDAMIDFAISNGYVLAPQHGWSEPNALFGAAAVKVVVTAAPASTQAPDLVVESPSADDTRVDPGESFRLRATVRNQGDGEADATTMRYYRSTDSTIDTSDTEVSSERIGSLDPDETDSEFEPLDAPTTGGTYYYGVCVDAVSGESNTGNNCSTAVAVEVVEGDPNLVVWGESVNDNSLAEGASFTLSVSVDNLGTAPAAASTLRYYLSTDSTINSSDTRVGGTETVNRLGVDESQDFSETLTAPNSAGVYYLGACVDTVAGESNTGDNCTHTGIPIGVGNVSPDLEVYSPSVYEWDLDAGEEFNMGFQVRNQGTGPSPVGGASLKYYRSADATISSSDTELPGSRNLGVMAPSATRSISYEITIPSSGTYYYGACVEVVEGDSNSQNNCAAVLKVTVN